MPRESSGVQLSAHVNRYMLMMELAVLALFVVCPGRVTQAEVAAA
jgi:hypothetical protein